MGGHWDRGHSDDCCFQTTQNIIGVSIAMLFWGERVWTQKGGVEIEQHITAFIYPQPLHVINICMSGCILCCDLTEVLLSWDITVQLILESLGVSECVRVAALDSVSPLLVRNVTLQFIVTRNRAHYRFLAVTLASWNTVLPPAVGGTAAIYVRIMLLQPRLSGAAVCSNTAPCSVFWLAVVLLAASDLA